tara:strand:+ start:878 stop:1105 length:228 start_codon:yes stop_codon:yes gene_type:complete
MPSIIACYNAYTSFEVPDGVFLLPEPYGPLNVYGRWYIHWNTLIYLDKDLEECRIKGSEPDLDCKKPESIEFSED